MEENNKRTEDDQDIFSAIKCSDLRKVASFLASSGDPSLLFMPEGLSPMHLAAGIKGTVALDIVSMLLIYGGNPNVRSFDGTTPVHISAAWGRHRTLRLLLKYGGDPIIRDDDSCNAFDYARENNQKKTLLALTELVTSSPLYKETMKKKNDAEKHLLANKNLPLNYNSDIVRTETYTVDWDHNHHKQTINSGKLSTDNISVQFKKISFDGNDSIQTWFTVDEFLHVNDAEQVALVEQHWIPCDLNGSVSEKSFCTADTKPLWCVNRSAPPSLKAESVSSSILKLNDDELRNQLKLHNENPGPITTTTRRVYLRRLTTLRQGNETTCDSNHNQKFSTQLNGFIYLKQDVKLWDALEDNFIKEFTNSKHCQSWRGGMHRSFFNYILLDPRLLKNLHHKVSILNNTELFSIFLNSIFYIGKGKNARSYDHFCEALKLSKKPSSKKTKKHEKILEIWKEDFGVVSLHTFHSSIAVEAFTREACMIDAIGLINLTNVKGGEYYGQIKKWPSRDKCRLGIIFLYRAMQIFFQEGEKQIRPFNI